MIQVGHSCGTWSMAVGEVNRMALNKFFVEYDNEQAGLAGLLDEEVGPMGYSYEYQTAYRRAKQLVKDGGATRVRVVRRARGAPEEVVAEVTP